MTDSGTPDWPAPSDWIATPDWTAPLPLFVYGTLRPGLGNHALYCADLVAARDASVAARLVEMPDGYPVIVEPALVEDSSARTLGTLLTFADPAAALRRIDVLEGFRPEGGAPLGVADHHYVRTAVRAALADGSTELSWTYVLPAADAAAGTWVPGGDWIAHGGRTI